MKTLIIALLLSFSALAEYDTIAINGKVIATGDRAARLRDVAGEPDYVSEIRDGYGHKIGETWEYKINGRYVTFDIYGGEIAEISD